MAIYSLSMSNVSRAKGSSSCSSLAYISGMKIYDERLDKTYQYGHADRIVAFETMLPDNAPEVFQDCERLFNEIEMFDKSQRAKPSKKIIMALPREFDLERQKEVVETFIKNNITSNEYCCSYAIHHDKDNTNPHVHILVANRKVNENGFQKIKSKKEYVLDAQGQRVPIIDPDTGLQKVDKRNRKQWKRRDVLVNQLDTREYLQDIRADWSNCCNQYLEKDNQIDHRSNEERGIETIPTIHEGYYARQREKMGMISQRCEINRQIKEKNKLIKKMIEALKNITNELKQYTEAKGEELNERVKRLLERRKTGGRIRDNVGRIGSSESTSIQSTITNARTQLDSVQSTINDSNARADSSREKHNDRELQRLRFDDEQVTRERGDSKSKSTSSQSRNFDLER